MNIQHSSCFSDDLLSLRMGPESCAARSLNSVVMATETWRQSECISLGNKTRRALCIYSCRLFTINGHQYLYGLEDILWAAACGERRRELMKCSVSHICDSALTAMKLSSVTSEAKQNWGIFTWQRQPPTHCDRKPLRLPPSPRGNACRRCCESPITTFCYRVYIVNNGGGSRNHSLSESTCRCLQTIYDISLQPGCYFLHQRGSAIAKSSTFVQR
ncbi:hypothetical protein EYF80_007647 [Liparis tanakae]|uniref:Uncharacterized protein n=1 Tax=Liparis tanakae TaxID=230148 RepID=A0A4Z2IVZ4_9TELE|nr:hypothetical protein EYF80_007647 [Liparis tanakae]